MFSCLHLPQPCPNKYHCSVQVLMSYVLDGSCSGHYLLVTNKQGTSLIVVTCMDAYRSCITRTHAHAHTHAHTLILS